MKLSKREKILKAVRTFYQGPSDAYEFNISAITDAVMRIIDEPAEPNNRDWLSEDMRHFIGSLWADTNQEWCFDVPFATMTDWCTRVAALEADLQSCRDDYAEHVSMVAHKERPAYDEQQRRINALESELAEAKAENESLRRQLDAAKYLKRLSERGAGYDGPTS